MDWIKVFFILLITCIVIFIISKIWTGLVDGVINIFKNIFARNKDNSTDSWHSLEDIRKEDKDRNSKSK